MPIEMIPLERLAPHPANSNVMSEALVKKLARHIGRSDRYPPLIVRPLGDDTPPRYQLLDGHHRVEVLRRLGRAEARCVVWEVDDDEALVLLGTLNRLEGTDDPRKRAALVEQLTGRLDTAKLAGLLPEDRAALERLLTLRQAPPAPRAAPRLADMPVAVHFFLRPDQRRRLEVVLRAAGANREEGLMQLVERAEADRSTHDPSEPSSPQG